MSVLIDVLVFLGVLSVLIVIHEFGHFIAARLFGIGVERFSIGFGPLLMRRQLWGTEFCVSALPLGGYVKLHGEEAKDSQGQATEFWKRPLYQKAGVVVAGPVMNAILAFVLFAFIAFMGPIYEATTQIGQLAAEYPAIEAGLQADDRIVRIDNHKIEVWEDILGVLDQNKGEAVRIDVERGEERLTFSVEPKRQEVVIDGVTRTVGRIGIGPKPIFSGYEHKPILTALGLGFKQTWVTSKLILSTFGQLVTGKLNIRESLQGPVGIYFLVGESAKAGIFYLLQLLAYISVCLFVFNLLPIPAMDGGHLFFMLIELVIRRPLPEIIKERLTATGFAMLMGLLIYMVYVDFDRRHAFDGLATMLGFK